MTRPSPRDLAYALGHLTACRQVEYEAIVDVANAYDRHARATAILTKAKLDVAAAAAALSRVTEAMSRHGLVEESLPDAPKTPTD